MQRSLRPLPCVGLQSVARQLSDALCDEAVLRSRPRQQQYSEASVLSPG